jgi:excinuclease ABC subunit A
MPSHSNIELRGVRVHNLQNVDVDIPLGQFTVITGVSGSGKSSLAFDTLYAEGQRRYVESFSNYSRRFLDRFEKPDADRIEPIPPAVAVRQRSPARSRRSTVGTATEIYDSLRVLFARIGAVECPRCNRRIEKHTPASVQTVLAGFEVGTRFMVCFPVDRNPSPPAPLPQGERGEQRPRQGRRTSSASQLRELSEAGFNRLIVGDRSVTVDQAAGETAESPVRELLVVVDRLIVGESSRERLADSLELAFRYGDGACVVFSQASAAEARLRAESAYTGERTVDGIEHRVLTFWTQSICPSCRTEFLEPEPALFNFNSPLGACPCCRGAGEVPAAAIGQAGPDGRPIDKTLAQQQAPRICPECLGARLRPEALAVRIRGQSIADLARFTAAGLADFLAERHDHSVDPAAGIANQVLAHTTARLKYLIHSGLGYLTLNRPLRTLSAGEAQRVRLTAALGSNLVNVLYVLDEPTTGLHPRDTERLVQSILGLRQAGNTVVVVEHDAELIQHADLAIDIGPGAGRDGGRVVFRGPPAELLASQTATADFLSGRRHVTAKETTTCRVPTGWLHLTGVNHHNLHDVSVDIPLGVLCVVTGVSGSGKSSLVEETLYPAVRAGLAARTAANGKLPDRSRSSDENAASLSGPSRRCLEAGRFESLTGLDQIDSVLLIDQGPVGRTGRGNAAGFLNLFGQIRSLFAQTTEAKVHNFSARHFSFNSAGGGRCETCQGRGSLSVDLQFLPDVVMTCPDCHGARYRQEILDVRFRGLSIAEVLGLSVKDAFSFFRGHHRLQRRLKVLGDVGLDYMTLGQPADTFSGGESQRLKIAAFLSRFVRSPTLFVIDEPTTGLHPADVARLIDCLGQITSGGHSLVVIEHDINFIRSADYLIDLGPEAGSDGGQIVATGTPAEVAAAATSVKGRLLAARR